MEGRGRGTGNGRNKGGGSGQSRRNAGRLSLVFRKSGVKAMCPRGSSMADWLGAIGRFRTLALTVLQKKAELPHWASSASVDCYRFESCSTLESSSISER